MLMWNKRVVEKLHYTVGAYSVSSSGVWKMALTGCFLVCISQIIRKRTNLLVKLKEGINIWEVPWCVAGDFNAVHFPTERVGAYRLTLAMTEFSDYIGYTNLVYFPLIKVLSEALIIRTILQGQNLHTVF